MATRTGRSTELALLLKERDTELKYNCLLRTREKRVSRAVHRAQTNARSSIFRRVPSESSPVRLSYQTESPPIHVIISRCRADYRVDLARPETASRIVTPHTSRHCRLSDRIPPSHHLHSCHLAWSPRETSSRYHGQIVASIPLRSSDGLQLQWANRPWLPSQGSDAREPGAHGAPTRAKSAAIRIQSTSGLGMDIETVCAVHGTWLTACIVE